MAGQQSIKNEILILIVTGIHYIHRHDAQLLLEANIQILLTPRQN